MPKKRAALVHGPSSGRKRLEDVRQNHQEDDPYRTAQFNVRRGNVNPSYLNHNVASNFPVDNWLGEAKARNVRRTRDFA